MGIVSVSSERSDRQITVAFSERKPFVKNANSINFGQNGRLQGLDIFLIEHFAQKLHIHINYLRINSSINVIFNDKNLSKYNSTSLRYIVFQ